MNSLFARLRDVFDFGPGGIDQEHERPLGLTEGELKVLRGFVDSTEHDVLLKVIDRTVNLYSESLLNADQEKLADLRSTIVGLRMAASLPKTIISHLEQEDDLHVGRAARESEQRARRVASFGTPYWRAGGRNGNDR